MGDPARKQRFEATVLVHLDAAFNLARWMLREDAAAEDAVQEASLRALRHFDGLQGPSAKAWFMAVVRNACLDRMKQDRRQALEDPYDDELHGSAADTPEAVAERQSQGRWLRDCVLALPAEYREVIVLRELEGLSYKEISAIVEVPIGTVMSRLSRARDLLQRRASVQQTKIRS